MADASTALPPKEEAMRSSLCGLVASVVVLATSIPAMAQLNCATRTEIVELLGQDFREKQNAIGLSADGRLVEIFSADDGTWTMLITTPDSISCLITHGQDWMQAPIGAGSDEDVSALDREYLRRPARAEVR